MSYSEYVFASPVSLESKTCLSFGGVARSLLNSPVKVTITDSAFGLCNFSTTPNSASQISSSEPVMPSATLFLDSAAQLQLLRCRVRAQFPTAIVFDYENSYSQCIIDNSSNYSPNLSVSIVTVPTWAAVTHNATTEMMEKVETSIC